MGEVTVASPDDQQQPSRFAELELQPELNGGWIRIHISAADRDPLWVTNDPDSPQYHQPLFRDLRQTLIARHQWPFANHGAETEQPDVVSRFHPIPIRGKPLSQTIIEDRGER